MALKLLLPLLMVVRYPLYFRNPLFESVYEPQSAMKVIIVIPIFFLHFLVIDHWSSSTIYLILVLLPLNLQFAADCIPIAPRSMLPLNCFRVYLSIEYDVTLNDPFS